ncbi:MAG: HEAT repeat domain-containing protein, partial [Armatimonadetes bacterium]|nr:HEAT repeat domain-containing protein [Anaerolineae bacterium]
MPNRIPRPIALVLLLLVAVFIAIYFATGSAYPIFLLAALIPAAISLIDPALTLADRYLTDPTLRSGRPTGTVERYFQTWLTEYGREQSLFASTANENSIPRQYRDEQQATYTDITEVVEEYGRFVLIGEPGEGKSTALKNLMAQAIYNFRRSNGQTPLPLWINLGFGDNPVDADDLIRYWWYEQYGLPGGPEPYLNRNSMILYLDGLNEMPEDGGSRSERAASLRSLLARYPKIPFIITCRNRDYEDDQDLGMKLPVLRVLPLDARRIEAFIFNQLGSLDFWNAIKDNPAQMQLASVSYRLKMMLDLYQAPPVQIPDNLNTLLSSYAQLKYNSLARAERVHTKTWAELEIILQQLAYRIIVRRKGTAVSVGWAQQEIGRDAVKDGIEMGLLRREGGVVRYYNHVMHGYFAMPLLLPAFRKGDRAERISPKSIDILQHFGDLGEAAAPAVTDMMEALISPDPVIRQFAAFALGRIGEPSAPAVHALIKSLSDEAQPVREFSAFALGRIGTAAAPAIPSLTPILKDANPGKRMIAALVLRQIGNAAAPAMTALIEALSDTEQSVSRFAALTLGQIGS